MEGGAAWMASPACLRLGETRRPSLPRVAEPTPVLSPVQGAKRPTGERDFALEERANAWIVREGRGPELDNEEALGQINPVDQRPDRGGFAGLLIEAITIRRRDESEITVGDCGRRQRYRSLLLLNTARGLLSVANTLWARVVIEPSQGIGVNPLGRGRDPRCLVVFVDHHKPPLGVHRLDCIERQQAPTPENDPVSTDREPLPARLRIIDQLDDQPDSSAAQVEYRIVGRRAQKVSLATPHLHAAEEA
jgi:hypothetical protein